MGNYICSQELQCTWKAQLLEKRVAIYSKKIKQYMHTLSNLRDMDHETEMEKVLCWRRIIILENHIAYMGKKISDMETLKWRFEGLALDCANAEQMEDANRLLESVISVTSEVDMGSIKNKMQEIEEENGLDSPYARGDMTDKQILEVMALEKFRRTKEAPTHVPLPRREEVPMKTNPF